MFQYTSTTLGLTAPAAVHALSLHPNSQNYVLEHFQDYIFSKFTKFSKVVIKSYLDFFSFFIYPNFQIHIFSSNNKHSIIFVIFFIIFMSSGRADVFSQKMKFLHCVKPLRFLLPVSPITSFLLFFLCFLVFVFLACFCK